MRKKWLSGLLTLTTVLSLGACSQGQSNASSLSKLKDGEYTSKQTGHNGPMEVAVSVKEGKISGINLKSHFETPGVSDKAIKTDLPMAIIKNQSVAVDSITGATISSGAVKRAVEDAIKQAGGDVKNFQTKPAAVKPEKTELSADVVIIGGGGAGLSAAVTAVEKGASVIIVEKAGYVGGNTMISGGIYNTPNKDLQSKEKMPAGADRLWQDALNEKPVSPEHKALQEKVKQEYDAWKKAGKGELIDTPAWFALQTWNGGDKVADLKLVEKMANSSLDGLHWLKGLGWNYNDKVVAGAGSMYPRTHSVETPLGTGYIRAYMDKLEKNDKVKILYNTKAEKITMDGNKAVGATGTDKDGNQWTFKANKSVIITTGGFAGDLKLVQEYNTTGKWPDLTKLKSSNLPAIKGDGIKMAKELGAELRDMDQIQLLYVCDPATGQATKGTFQPKGAEGLIYVNKEGKRFVREDGRRDEISLAMMKQTEGIGYSIQCADSNVHLDSTKDLGGVPLKALVESKRIFMGETIEEAAKNAGVDPAGLKATIEGYNKLVEEKAAKDEFGRALFTTKLEKGPWFIVPNAPAVHHTMGGIVINEQCQVMGKDKQPIQGLFAAGEVVGGIHGGNRLGGNALVDTVVFGRIAGAEAAK